MNWRKRRKARRHSQRFAENPSPVRQFLRDLTALVLTMILMAGICMVIFGAGRLMFPDFEESALYPRPVVTSLGDSGFTQER
jgi:hypothetical protein